MSYFTKRRSMGEDDPCTDNPDDPVCQEFYKPPAPAPAPAPGPGLFTDLINRGVAALTPAAPGKVVAKASMSPVVMVAGVGIAGAAAWWLFLRKKK